MNVTRNDTNVWRRNIDAKMHDKTTQANENYTNEIENSQERKKIYKANECDKNFEVKLGDWDIFVLYFSYLVSVTAGGP